MDAFMSWVVISGRCRDKYFTIAQTVTKQNYIIFLLSSGTLICFFLFCFIFLLICLFALFCFIFISWLYWPDMFEYSYKFSREKWGKKTHQIPNITYGTAIHSCFKIYNKPLNWRKNSSPLKVMSDIFLLAFSIFILGHTFDVVVYFN